MPRHTARVRAGNDRASLYTEITDKIIAELEAGRIPWVQPWGTAAIKAPLAMPRKPSISVSRIGDSASVQAATRVNAEQASKRTMCRPTRRPYRGRLKWLGELSEDYAPLLHRGIGGGMYTRKAHETREAPRRGQR